MVNRSDVACRCGCGFDALDYELKYIVEDLESKFGYLTYHSGCRCPEHNKKEGGHPNSYHTKGKALDFSIVGCELQAIYGYLSYVYDGKYEIIIYKTFIHIALQEYEERIDKR